MPSIVVTATSINWPQAARAAVDNRLVSRLPEVESLRIEFIHEDRRSDQAQDTRRRCTPPPSATTFLAWSWA